MWSRCLARLSQIAYTFVRIFMKLGSVRKKSNKTTVLLRNNFILELTMQFHERQSIANELITYLPFL